MKKCEKILSGPALPGKKLTGSLAENLIPRMKALAEDHVDQVDGATGESITSHEFLRLSLEITEGLIEYGLEEGDIVALLSPNNIKTMAAAMGVLFSGAIFVPLDYNLKSAERKILLKQFQPKYIICENKRREEIWNGLKEIGLNSKIILTDSISTHDGEFLILDDLRKKVDVDSYTPRKVRNPEKQAAIIICSSGSTGLPKGVALSHYTLLYNCLAGEDSNVADSSFLITSPLYWISGVVLFIISSYVGSTRYIPKSLDAEGFLEAIQACKPFFLLLSPSSLLQLVSHSNVKNYDLSSVKVIFNGGALLGSNGVKKIREILPEVVITPTYGMTETGGSIAMLKGPYKDLVLGSVLPNIQVKVVDVDTGESLGPNKSGECRVKTPTIMLGYYNNEDATKAAFDEDGWFRTGDLVYYDEDEVLYIVGRIKEIVKCRNHQVSLSELEAFIIGLPGVKDVAVIPIPNEADMFHLKALIVKNPNSDITAEDIVRSVKDNYSYPKQLHEGVEFVDSLPRSEIGKLKRGQLLKTEILCRADDNRR